MGEEEALRGLESCRPPALGHLLSAAPAGLRAFGLCSGLYSNPNPNPERHGLDHLGIALLEVRRAQEIPWSLRKEVLAL